MPENVARHFRQKTIRLAEGDAYLKCVFEQCVFEFDGSVARFHGCDFRDCRWNFVGAAAATINFLGGLCQMQGNEKFASDILGEISGDSKLAEKLIAKRARR